jgi:hypothetical protein
MANTRLRGVGVDAELWQGGSLLHGDCLGAHWVGLGIGQDSGKGKRRRKRKRAPARNGGEETVEEIDYDSR